MLALFLNALVSTFPEINIQIVIIGVPKKDSVTYDRIVLLDLRLMVLFVWSKSL